MFYCVSLLLVPLVYTFKKLFKAQNAKDYHLLSKVIKFVMLAGLISLVFFKIYS